MLEAIPLFHSLSAKQLASIGARAAWRVFEKGDVILRQGEFAEFFYVIGAGQVKVYMSEGEREVILKTLATGDFFGELPMFDREPRSASVAAIERCHVQMLSYSAFQQVIDSNPEISKRLMETLAKRLRDADRKISTLALMDIASRVSRTLLELAIVSNGRKVVGEPFTQKDLAGMVGASREMVNRTLHDLMQQGYIDVQRKSITILDENMPMHY
ncbi:MAG: Crp/Fnr family transcriptional regulator [Usitatibacteraceae bacterium]